MKTFKILGFGCLLMITLAGMHCHRKPEQIFVSQDTKDYLVFPVGSYWVYRADSLGFSDTLVTESLDTVIEVDEEGDFEIHYYSMVKGSNHWDNHESYKVYPRSGGYDESFATFFLLDTQMADEIYHSPVYNAGQAIFKGESDATIRGITYQNVRHFISPTITGDTLDFWFAKGIGTVKYQVLGTDSIYELESYHINS